MKDKEDIQVVELVNRKETRLKVINFGAAIFSLEFKTPKNTINVVVGPVKPETYVSDLYHEMGKHFGASVGRYAGRISQGGFTINSKKYDLFEKNGVHLHGGKCGFSHKFWDIVEEKKGENPSVTLEYISPDGEEGYPGKLTTKVTYQLTEDNTVEITYVAETDKETVVNLTNHAYFNLNGAGSVNNHSLELHASKILESDSQNLPTGKFLEVENSEVDFQQMKKIGDTVLDTVFSVSEGNPKAILKGDQSNITLEVETNQPAVIVYIPEVLPDDWEYGIKISNRRTAICLETQKFPDSPHQPQFPTVLLKPGEQYINKTKWKFTIGG